MKFKFRLNAISILLLVAVTLLCGYGIALNVITLINAIETLKIILNVILLLVNLALIVTVFSIALFSSYTVNKKGIVLRLGFFKVVYKKEELHSIKLFSKTQKLVLYLMDAKFTVIVINASIYQAFTKAIQNEFPFVYEEVVSE